MTPKEREIAVAAMELSAPTYPQLLQKLFERTKVKSDEVQKILDKLCNESILNRWAAPPARNVAAGDPPANIPVREKVPSGPTSDTFTTFESRVPVLNLTMPLQSATAIK